MWKLPDNLVELFGTTRELPTGRWQSGPQIYQGVVTGSIRLVEAMTGPGSRMAIEKAKRALLVGSGLPPNRFADLMIRAMDRGRQLAHSMGLAMDSADVATPSLSEQNVQNPFPSKAAEPTHNEENPRISKTPSAPLYEEPVPAPIQTRPLETLQAFQDSLREAKDLNGLLGTFVQSLHQNAGFDRVGLALLNPNDSDLLVDWLVLGAIPLAPNLRALSGSLSHEPQFFLKALKRLDPLLVTDFTTQAAGAMKQEFVDTWKPVSGILAPLRVGTRPIGLIYCDRGTRNQPVLLQESQIVQLVFMSTTLG